MAIEDCSSTPSFQTIDGTAAPPIWTMDISSTIRHGKKASYAQPSFTRNSFQPSMPQMRCQKCRSIKSEFVFSRELNAKGQDIVYDSLEYIDESARRGCDMCALLFRHLMFSIASSSHYSGPVRLHVGVSIGIEWGSLSSLMVNWSPWGLQNAGPKPTTCAVKSKYLSGLSSP